MKLLIYSLFLLSTTAAHSQSADSLLFLRFSEQVGGSVDRIVYVNRAGDTVIRLDPSKYFQCFTDTFKHFAVVGLNDDRNWWAIDRKQRLLFQVFNPWIGEPEADEITEGFIRITDKSNKVGFANENGQIVISTRFDWASSFKNGNAIFSMDCKVVPILENGKPSKEHFDLVCKNYGYIDTSGKVLAEGFKTEEEVKQLLKW
jgi:hypothetical protein